MRKDVKKTFPTPPRAAPVDNAAQLRSLSGEARDAIGGRQHTYALTLNNGTEPGQRGEEKESMSDFWRSNSELEFPDHRFPNPRSLASLAYL